jgi:flagellar hook-basal body complex protein FliE
MNPINIVPGTGPLDGLEQVGGAKGTQPSGKAGGPSFGEVLKDSLSQVNQLQNEADQAIKDLATGGPTTLHDTMLALQKADLSFKLMMQVRNKIVEAYQEVVRMQV